MMTFFRTRVNGFSARRGLVENVVRVPGLPRTRPLACVFDFCPLVPFHLQPFHSPRFSAAMAPFIPEDKLDNLHK